MAFDGTRRFVGLGFGAIQAGLFVYEAQRTGAYAEPLVVDVRADLVSAVRAAEGLVRINIARPDGIDMAELGPLDVADSSIGGERERVIDAIARADELATALPSVVFYHSDGPTSPHLLLAQGLLERTSSRPLIVFCAENHRDAASLLRDAVLGAVEPAERDGVRARVRFVDTVIGKMSGVIGNEAEMRTLALAPITSTMQSAFLVEEFDRILAARVDPDGGAAALHPGMPVLREVDDLAPFEDAKLLGHNATHALAGFLGTLLDVALVADLRDVPGAMGFLRAAFIEESGRALIARHAGSDPLFTPAGFADFADDLLARMVNPYLVDTIERAARDPRRKLGWDDRLIGLLRLGLSQDVPMRRYSMGVAAGLEILRREGASCDMTCTLVKCWPDDVDEDEAHAVLAAVAAGSDLLTQWRDGGFAELSIV